MRWCCTYGFASRLSNSSGPSERSGCTARSPCAKNPGHPIDLYFRGRIADFVSVYLGHASLRDDEGKRLSIEGPAQMARRLVGWLRLDKVVGRNFPVVPPAPGA